MSFQQQLAEAINMLSSTVYNMGFVNNPNEIFVVKAHAQARINELLIEYLPGEQDIEKLRHITSYKQQLLRDQGYNAALAETKQALGLEVEDE